jgi:hypothetical protein
MAMEIDSNDTEIVTIGPPQFLPLASLASFWAHDHLRLTGFKYIEKRDGERCMVGNCPYDHRDALDNCHIVARGNGTYWGYVVQYVDIANPLLSGRI